MKQSKIDSLMEAVVNTAIGFIISLITWIILAWAMGIPLSFAENLFITGVFTVVSIARSYTLRRLFNGRSVWSVIEPRVPFMRYYRLRSVATDLYMAGRWSLDPPGPTDHYHWEDLRDALGLRKGTATEAGA